MNEEVLSLPISAILMNDRLRAVDVAEVDRLALSIKEVGQITPIEVRQIDELRYSLVAGAHRLAACLRCGMQTVRAVLFEGDNNTARLREIDENLFRRELSAFDQAEFLAERRIVWEQMFGQVKRGGDRRAKAQVEPLLEALRKSGFLKDTSERLGLSRPVLKRALYRKAHMAEDVWASLRGTADAENGAFLDKLAKLDRDTQRAVVEFSKQRGCSAAAAFTALRREETQTDPYPLLTIMKRMWPKATEPERRKIRELIKFKPESEE